MMAIQEILAEIIILSIEVIILVVGGFLIKYIIAKIDTEKLNQNYTLAKIVINSVEQTTRSGMRSSDKGKKGEAHEAIKRLTNGKLSDAEIERLVESAVYEMNLVNKNSDIKDHRHNMAGKDD